MSSDFGIGAAATSRSRHSSSSAASLGRISSCGSDASGIFGCERSSSISSACWPVGNLRRAAPRLRAAAAAVNPAGACRIGRRVRRRLRAASCCRAANCPGRHCLRRPKRGGGNRAQEAQYGRDQHDRRSAGIQRRNCRRNHLHILALELCQLVGCLVAAEELLVDVAVGRCSRRNASSLTSAASVMTTPELILAISASSVFCRDSATSSAPLSCWVSVAFLRGSAARSPR